MLILVFVVPLMNPDNTGIVKAESPFFERSLLVLE